MLDDPLYLGRIQRRFYRVRYRLIAVGLFSLLGSITIYTYISLEPSSILSSSSSFPATVANVAIIALVSISALSVVWSRWFVTVLSMVGIMLVLGSLFFPVQEYIPGTYRELDTFDPDDRYAPDGSSKVKHLAWRYAPAHALTPASKTVMFYLGVGIIGTCMLVVYKPSLLYVRNRPSDDPPYPVWDSGDSGYTTYRHRNMVPLVRLLSTQERYMLSRYRYVHVRIGEEVYLVTPKSLVPDNSEVVRNGNTKLFLGIR